MDLSVARKLIAGGVILTRSTQRWADLGAGDGLFTSALAELLPANSTIVAIDKDQGVLKNIPAKINGTTIETVVADLKALPGDLLELDGVVMANSLHYVRDQVQFLAQLKSRLRNSGVIVLVEYDLEKSNPWVPYPISKRRLVGIAKEASLHCEIFLETIKSRLNSSEIYSAVLKQQA